MYCRGNKGMTLIEVVVAFLLLVSLLAPIVTLMHSSIYGCHSAGKKTQLIAMGKAVMEDVLSDNPLPYGTTNHRVYEEELKITYHISIAPYPYMENLQSIRVAMTRDDEPDKEVVFVTLRYTK